MAAACDAELGEAPLSRAPAPLHPQDPHLQALLQAKARLSHPLQPGLVCAGAAAHRRHLGLQLPQPAAGQGKGMRRHRVKDTNLRRLLAAAGHRHGTAGAHFSISRNSMHTQQQVNVCDSAPGFPCCTASPRQHQHILHAAVHQLVDTRLQLGVLQQRSTLVKLCA